MSEKDQQEKISRLRGSGDFEVIKEEDGYTLLKRRLIVETGTPEY